MERKLQLNLRQAIIDQEAALKGACDGEHQQHGPARSKQQRKKKNTSSTNVVRVDQLVSSIKVCFIYLVIYYFSIKGK